MKRLVLAVIILLMLSGTALADAYQIRVTWHVKLRASYSLDSPVVARALAGDVLQVVGRYNRWLKIDRDGQTLWLADWVDYTRLDLAPAGQDSASEQTQSDIDNCCFVNRLCQSEQEWVDGYWAYQRNECPAPPQAGSSALQLTGHAIRIEASPLNVGLISEALNRLRAGSQKWYDYVISSNALIREDPNTATCYALSGQRIIGIPPYGRFIATSDIDFNLASVMTALVHEACHIHRHFAGYEYNGYTKVEEELACIAKEKVALRESGLPHLLHVVVGLGSVHCEGDLTKHPGCRWVRENCEWSADHQITSCPAMGLTTVDH